MADTQAHSSPDIQNGPTHEIGSWMDMDLSTCEEILSHRPPSEDDSIQGDTFSEQLIKMIETAEAQKSVEAGLPSFSPTPTPITSNMIASRVTQLDTEQRSTIQDMTECLIKHLSLKWHEKGIDSSKELSKIQDSKDLKVHFGAFKSCDMSKDESKVSIGYQLQLGEGKIDLLQMQDPVKPTHYGGIYFKSLYHGPRYMRKGIECREEQHRLDEEYRQASRFSGPGAKLKPEVFEPPPIRLSNDYSVVSIEDRQVNCGHFWWEHSRPVDPFKKAK